MAVGSGTWNSTTSSGRQQKAASDPEHASDIADPYPQRCGAEDGDLMTVDDHDVSVVYTVSSRQRRSVRRWPVPLLSSAAMSGWLYAFECVATPCAIAVAMYILFGVWDRRRRPVGDDNGLPPVDYHI